MAERPTFFLDRNLGNKIVCRALREAGVTVEVHSDHFPETEEDDTGWIADVAERGWVILTKDNQIRYNESERDVVDTSKARIFILNSSRMNGNEMADFFVEKLAEIESLAGTQAPPFIATISHEGMHIVFPNQRPGQ